MTISTYTETQPVNSVADDSPQTQEAGEDVEEGAFAKLLAGLLWKIEINETDIEAADFSIGEEDIQLFDGKDTDRISFFDNETEKPVNPETDSIKLLLEKEFPEIEIHEEQASFLMSAEHLFVRSNDQIISDEETGVDFLQELPEIETPDFRLAGENTDFSTFKTDEPMTGVAESAPLADGGIELIAETAAAQENEESLPIETDGKKERVLSKDANVEPRPESSRVEEAASLRKEPEKPGQSRLDEARNRRRDRVAVDIRDQRTASSNVSNNMETRVNAGVETVSGRRAQGDAPREMTLELRLPEGQNQQAQTTWEVKSGTALENMLSRELHQNFNGDIVRHASMALRDGGEAVIRLALKPDTLGNVKIHLELTENKITGRIIVESEETLNAFRKEIASLEQAFRDSGFTNADLNLSLAADASNAQWQERETDAYTPKTVASRYDSSPEGAGLETILVDVFFGHRPGSINMFA